jgi:HSP20 family protein
MALGDLVPFRWGGLRRWEPDERPFEAFRHQMENLHRDMDRLFEGIWDGERGAFGSAEIVPKLDMTEDDKAFRVCIELPGMDEKDIDVTLTDRLLTIRGEKKEEKETKDKDVYRRERTYGSFRRALEIPSDVDAAKIDASFKKGVLTIELPKSEEAKEKIKHISVKAA